jgi:hypothetical protein
MVIDTAAAERMVDRLLAVRWDDDAAYERQRSRGRLTSEFLRRTALWAQAVGAETGWPFSDLAGAMDPEVAVEPALLNRLESDQTPMEFPIRPAMAVNIVRWAALGDLPQQRFPGLADPYEPLLALFERGGPYSLGNGLIELGYGSVSILSVGEWAELEPLPIDEATLDALDEES